MGSKKTLSSRTHVRDLFPVRSQSSGNSVKRSLVAARCRDDRFGWTLWGWLLLRNRKNTWSATNM